jgi:hypothetical protein
MESTVSTPQPTTDEFNFDSLEAIEIPVTYKGQKYLLCDASGGTVAKYRAAMLSGAQMQRNHDKSTKVSGMGGLADAEFILLAGCLWVTDPSGARGKQNVDERVIRSWPNRITEPLCKKAKEISMVDADESKPGDTGPKDSPSTTESGSK